ncbi:ABC transporter ATP-binding protein [Hymenobacter rubripertinctus]|nr:ABC transporter ATP-binding protein [Hymenobacter rubripertinctus]
MPAAMFAIDLQHLSKSYGPVQAVQDVSLRVPPGELFGLIGPDGAGKTTLFRIMATLLLPDAGTAAVAGHDTRGGMRAIREVVGYMPGRFSLYPDLTVAENLDFFAALFRTTVRANYELIRDIYEPLAPFRDRRAGALSGGMKQKLALCCALIHKPEVLLLDEPTTGVDAVSRQEFWQVLGQLKARGITIMVSTPYMDEAARCERVALLQEGQVLRVDTPAALQAAYPVPLYAVRATGSLYPLLQSLRAYPATRTVYAFGEEAHLSLLPAATAAATTGTAEADLLGYLARAGHAQVQLRGLTPTIEDTFMELLGARPAATAPTAR